MHLTNRRKSAAEVELLDRDDAVVATDGELLVRFARHSDHRAFAQLVERHGGLVWIVCREMLGHHQDVEDAFQATFLILAERASSIRSSDSAAAWLHRVAQRTALAARRKRARQREEELVEETADGDAGPADISHRELIYVLLDELRKLPERYQVPLVLRYFERMSRLAIAAHTDSTVAQIQGRLVRGRRMLRSRMLRRGVSLSLATGAVANVSTEAETAITPAIANATAKRCLARKTSGDTTGITPMALWLANQGARTMWLASIFKIAATISAVFVVAGITWAVEGSGGGGKAQSPANAGVKADLAVVAPKTEAATAPTQRTPASTDDFANQLERNAANLEGELNRSIAEKADISAELELQKLQKARIQRELETTSDATVLVKSDLAYASEEDRKRTAAIEKRVGELQTEFKTSVRKIAEMQAAVDERERKAKHAQSLLDTIDQVRSQLELQKILDAAKPSSATFATVPDADYRIQPQDVLTVQAVGVLADQPLGDSFYVEPMGTIALGPTYGRVKVVGLSVLEAENAIRQKLSDVVAPENLKVQATLAAKRSAVEPTATDFWRKGSNDVTYTPSKAETQQVQIIEQLQKENAELKRTIDERQKPSSKYGGDSGRVIRSGDEIVVYCTLKTGERTNSRVEVDKNGTINLPAIRVGGLTEQQAKDALQKAISLNYPNAEVNVEVNSPPH